MYDDELIDKLKISIAYNVFCYRHLMGLISDKSGFLTESRLQSILKGFEDKDRNLIKVWNVFDSLDINGIDEIDALITYFLPYCFCPVCVDSGG